MGIEPQYPFHRVVEGMQVHICKACRIETGIKYVLWQHLRKKHTYWFQKEPAPRALILGTHPSFTQGFGDVCSPRDHQLWLGGVSAQGDSMKGEVTPNT